MGTKILINLVAIVIHGHLQENSKRMISIRITTLSVLGVVHQAGLNNLAVR